MCTPRPKSSRKGQRKWKFGFLLYTLRTRVEKDALVGKIPTVRCAYWNAKSKTWVRDPKRATRFMLVQEILSIINRFQRKGVEVCCTTRREAEGGR